MAIKAAFVIALGLVCSGSALGAGVSGSCAIRDGEMIGTIHNDTSSSIWLSGEVEFRLYDDDFDVLYTYRTRKSGSVSRGSQVLAEETIRSSDLDDAHSCTFDVSDAVDDGGGDTDPPYIEFCTIEDDKAVGSVRYTGGLSYFGQVHFELLDDDGDVVDTYSTTKSGLNGGSGVARVAEYRIPSIHRDEVVACRFDITDAIRD